MSSIQKSELVCGSYIWNQKYFLFWFTQYMKFLISFLSFWDVKQLFQIFCGHSVITLRTILKMWNQEHPSEIAFLQVFSFLLHTIHVESHKLYTVENIVIYSASWKVAWLVPFHYYDVLKSCNLTQGWVNNSISIVLCSFSRRQATF